MLRMAQNKALLTNPCISTAWIKRREIFQVTEPHFYSVFNEVVELNLQPGTPISLVQAILLTQSGPFTNQAINTEMYFSRYSVSSIGRHCNTEQSSCTQKV